MMSQIETSLSNGTGRQTDKSARGDETPMCIMLNIFQIELFLKEDTLQGIVLENSWDFWVLLFHGIS